MASLTYAHSEPQCAEVLAPIPGQRWECVAPAGHEPSDHIADDGTRW